MNRSTPGLPVHHQLLEFTQTHVRRVSDAIQPSHPLSSPSPPAPNPSQHQGHFQWVNSSHEVAKVFEFQLQHPRSGAAAERSYSTPEVRGRRRGTTPRPGKSLGSSKKALRVIPLHSLWENRDRWIVHPRKPVKCQLKVLPSSGLLAALKSLKQRTDFHMWILTTHTRRVDE